MQLKIAEIKDIDGILKLHAKYQLATIKEEDKKDGFVTTAFTKEQLTDIIEQEQGIFIAIENNIVLGYVMSASWQYWSKWAMFAFMIKELPKLQSTIKVGASNLLDNKHFEVYGGPYISRMIYFSILVDLY